MLAKDLSNSFHPCPKNKSTKEKSLTKINKRSKKQEKLERDRDKNIKKSGVCEFCKKKSDRLDPHEVYGGSNRKRSIQNNFVAMICRKCHSNEKVIAELRVRYQKEFEKTHTREEFIKIIGKSYI